MPSESLPQKHTMQAAAHDKKFADKMGIPQSVAREFVEADKRRAAQKAGMSPEIFDLMQKAR
jgi:hypothetical protein